MPDAIQTDSITVIVSILCSILASSGFWAYLQNRKEKNSAEKEMLTGLGHDRIMSLGEKYIARGFVTKDEYENLHDYLYKPYKKLGGNGSADHIMSAVNQLPVRSPLIIKEGEYGSVKQNI